MHHLAGSSESRRLTAADAPYDEYVSDPANPVPYRPRPITPTFTGPGWPVWLVQDQRFLDHRSDVLSWQTAPLTGSIHVAGDIVAELYASTTGTDADWAVKLIDVYPEDAPEDVATHTRMAGFELIIKQLGLRLEKRKALLPGIVIDHVERWSGN